jgi:SAM-dependent methyltransferase
MLRELARRLLFTSSTIRYAVEAPRLEEALGRMAFQGSLLDAGAGGGMYACSVYARRFSPVTALEYDERNFAILRRRLRHAGMNGNAVRGSILDIPFASGQFECVACTQVMEHLDDDRRAASELARVLRPGGYLLVTVPIPPAPWPEPDHVRDGYTLDGIAALFAPQGLRLVHSDSYFTADTQRIFHRIRRLGGYAPRLWTLRELRLTAAERAAAGPYCMLALMRKDA